MKLTVMKNTKSLIWGLWSVTCLALASSLHSQESRQNPVDQVATLSQMEALKKSVLELNRDLYILQEDLLFPASTQVAVYLSMDIGAFFTLDHVKLTLDEQTVAHYLYTANDRDALKRGAIQPVFQGNLTNGKHRLVAVINGKGPHNRDYLKAVSFDFDKSLEAKALEIKILDDESTQQPQMNVVAW